jgi:hypothetical protein
MDIYTAIDVIESCPGFTESDTPVGEAWAVVLSYLQRNTSAKPDPDAEPADPAPNLSLDVQAVMDAIDAQDGNSFVDVGVAVLIAAADQTKLGPDEWEGSKPDDYERGWNAALRCITRLAAELRQEVG